MNREVCLIMTPKLMELYKELQKNYPEECKASNVNAMVMLGWVENYQKAYNKTPDFTPDLKTLVTYVEELRNKEGKSFLNKEVAQKSEANPILVQFIKDIETLAGYYEGGGRVLSDDVPNFPNELDDKLNDHFMGGKELTLDDYRKLWKVLEFKDGKVYSKKAFGTTTTNSNAALPEADTKINIYAGTGENADLSNFAERPLNFGKTTAYSLPEGATSGAFKSKYPIYDIGKVTYSTKENPDSGESFVFDGLSDLFSGRRFKTVEGAFQAAKLVFTHPKGNGAKGNKYWQPKKFTQRENSIEGVYYNTSDVFVLTDEGEQLLQKFQEASGAQARSLGRQIAGLNRQEWDANSSKIMKAIIGRSFEDNQQALQRLLSTGNATLTHTQDKGKWGTEFPKLLMEVRDELRKENPQIGNSSNKQDIVIQLIDQLKASGINVLSRADMEKYLTEKGKLDPVYTLQAIKENQEMQDIKAKAIANGTFMKAPNGKPTNLTERQWLQVRTKNFINWFGDWLHQNPKKVTVSNKETVNKDQNWVDDSKVIKEAGHYYYTNELGTKKEITKQQFDDFNNGKDIVLSEKTYTEKKYDHSKVLDENGEPKVMYHITTTKGITIFDRAKSKHAGFWFSSDPNYYVKDAKNNINVDVVPVFLNIREPNEIGHNAFLNAVDGDVAQETLDHTKFDGWITRYYHNPEFSGDTYSESAPVFAMATTPNQIKSATGNNGMFSTENDNIQMFIGKKARTQFEQQLRKARPDMSNDEIKATLDFLHSLEDNKENTAYIKAAIRWIANKSLTLPQDHTKAYQVFEIARKKHLDLQKYNTLGELIASPEMQPKEKEKAKFNPDEAKTFSNKRTVTTEGGRVFTVYDVENTEEGQREVCKALAAHYKTSPWCLSTFTSKGEPTESAKRYWNEYSGIPRKIAFENGKPVAFSSERPESLGGWHTLDGIQVYVVGEFMPTGEMVTSIDKDTISEEKREEWVKKGYIYPNLIYARSYQLTDKGIEAFEKQKQEAWWDVADTHPQDSLSDSIISDISPERMLREVAEMVAEHLGLLGTPGEIDTLVEMQQRNIPLIEANYRNFVQGQREFVPVPVNPFPEEEIYDLPDDLPFFITPNGEVYGFVDLKGNIYLDETVISPEHPIHEYTHLWDRALAKNNPKLWEKGVKLMQEGASSLWNEIANSETYGKLWQSQGISGEKLTNLIASEVHARLVGVNGAKLLDQLAEEKGKANIIAKLKLWILDAWKELKATFSNWSQEEIDKLTLKDFNHMTVRDFADGINPNNTTVLSNESTLTTKQALDRANGFIGEVNRSPYTKQGGEFILKNDTPVLNALKVVMDRGHKPEKSSFGDEYDGQVSYNLGYSSGSKTVMAVTNRDLFDEGWEATDILLMRESERYGQPLESLTRINIESNKRAVFLVDENDKVLIDHLKEEGYKYELYTDNPTASSSTSNTTKDYSSYELYSGAADGSDKEWGAQARALGIKVKDYVVQDWDALSQEWKDKLDKEYQEVVRILGRKVLDKNTYRGKLVRRDMMQADKADAIFAIGTISSQGFVNGGTAYAATRGIMRGIPVYVFDQSDNTWKVWNNNSKSFVSTSEPTLTPHAAVIGTRGINEYGKAAIKSVLLKLTNNNEQQNRDILKESMSSKEHENC